MRVNRRRERARSSARVGNEFVMEFNLPYADQLLCERAFFFFLLLLLHILSLSFDGTSQTKSSNRSLSQTDF